MARYVTLREARRLREGIAKVSRSLRRADYLELARVYTETPPYLRRQAAALEKLVRARDNQRSTGQKCFY